MIKLREPFSQKIHLHIRRDMLQQLWDKYVPESSQQYGQIELVYLKNAPGDMEKQPEQIKLLLHLLLKNKRLQLNLMQYPAPVKIFQNQMKNNLQRMERYYTVQLKCSNPMLYRTVKQYFTLLEQAQEDRRRYQEWQKNYQEIEKQKDEYRLISLFSEKLREYLAQYSVNTLRTMEREFVSSLSETEYQTLAEELIWQEKPEILTYFNGWNEAQCENVFEILEKDTDMRPVLSLIPDQPVKEKLIAAAQRLEQREFCLFYHQVMKSENVEPQVVVWKENKTEMLSEIDRLAPEMLQQMWKQMGDVAPLPEQESLLKAEKDSHNPSVLQIQEQDIQDLETLRMLEKELLDSLLETEYRTFAERLIWQEKPELIAYFKSCEKDQCKEIVKKLEKDTYIRQILSSSKKQSAKKKLVSAAYKLEQKEFSLFYWQVVDLKEVNPQMVIWKNSRAQMLRSLDELGSESVKKVWTQMESVEPVKGNKHVFTEKLLHLQKQVQQNESRSFQEQIAVILEENALENITDIVDIEQLVQGISISEYTEKPADAANEPEFGFSEMEYPLVWDEAYQVIHNLEREQEIRRERIERQQVQVVETYQDIYRQILRTENILIQPQEDTVQSAEQIFREQYHEQLTGEEIQNIYEWSQALLNVHFAEEGADTFSLNQMEQQELTYVFRQINHDIEEQHGFEERWMLHWQENVSKDERIKKLLIYIRQLDERQKEQFIHYLADMVWLSVQQFSQRKISTVMQPDRTKQAGLPIQSKKQESVKKLLSLEDKELAERFLQVEDREFAKNLLQIEDRELIEKLLQIEDREFAKSLLRLEDRELVENLLQIEDREFAKDLLQIEDREFVKSLLQIEDRELTKSLLQVEDREFTKSLLQVEDKEFAKNLLRIEDREFAKSLLQLLQIEDKEFVEKLLRNDDRQLPDVSYKNLWEWGEVLLFYPEQQQEWEDADILAIPQQEAFSSDEAKQEDVQTQVIRRQIEVAKDRNRLQSLIRQINHQADMQLVYTDVQLRMPQVQTLLHKIEQLDEKQYGVLVKELVQIIQLQKLSYEESMEAVDIAVPAEKENNQYDARETNTVIVKQSVHENAYKSARKLLRIEDKEFIEKLLQMEDRKFAERLLQLKDRELIEKLLRIEDKEFVEKLLQMEDVEFAESLLQIEDRKLIEKLLQVEDREFVKSLLRIENRELAEKLLQIEDREFAKSLLQIEDREAVEKLLLNDDKQLPDVSYRNLWEWGEVLLLKDTDILSVPQREAFSFEDAERENIQTQVVRRQAEAEKDRSLLQNLIKQINRQTDIHLSYTELQLKMPQVQTLLHSVEQLNEKQYEVLVKELVQIIQIQKLSYEKMEAAKQSIQSNAYESDGKQLRMGNKELIEKLSQNSESQLPDVSYRNLWEWGEALLQHPFSDEAKQEDDQTQTGYQQTEIEKAKNHLQSLIRQINHRADVRLVYTDAQLRVPQIQDLLQYIRQLDVRQYGAFVKELAQVTMFQKLSYEEPVITFPESSAALLEQRMISYPILERYIQNYEEQRQLELYKDIKKVEQKIFPQNYEIEHWRYVTDNKDAGNDVHGTLEYDLMPYETGVNAYHLATHETSDSEYSLMRYEEATKEFAQITTYEKKLRENRYQPQELEYSVQKASSSEEDQQRNEVRMQRENAQIKSAQEQLDKKLKEVEHQLKKVEDSTKVKEDVKTFAEQVKRQLYEELHVEKLRRGLI